MTLQYNEKNHDYLLVEHVWSLDHITNCWSSTVKSNIKKLWMDNKKWITLKHFACSEWITFKWITLRNFACSEINGNLVMLDQPSLMRWGDESSIPIKFREFSTSGQRYVRIGIVRVELDFYTICQFWPLILDCWIQLH